MDKFALVILLAMAGCRSGPPQPIAIEPGDMCARCRMEVSQKRYAAELLSSGGDALKFDDIGCMVRYTRDHALDPRRQSYFVMDHGTGRWLEGRVAVYVKSAGIDSPMSGGLAAFADRGAATRFGATVHGVILTFEELWTSPS